MTTDAETILRDVLAEGFGAGWRTAVPEDARPAMVAVLAAKLATLRPEAVTGRTRTIELEEAC